MLKHASPRWALVALLGVLPAAAGADMVNPWAKTINNVVTSTVSPGKANWDPADPVTVSGQLRDNLDVNCADYGPVANADSLVVQFIPPRPQDQQRFGLGHQLCPAAGHRFRVVPGTDGNGNFSFSMKGGGVSWTGSGGVNILAGWVKLTFYKYIGDMTYLWIVRCGDSNSYPALGSSCPDSPGIYGRLASPDLNSDGYVDGSDLAAFAGYLGNPVTLESGWQADYNHSGPPTVDASDLAYFAGRMGKNCNSQKAGDDYAMDVRNLDDPGIRRLMARVGISDADVIAAWAEMGLSYDRRLAADRIAGRPLPVAVVPVPWGTVKTLYR